MIPQDWLPHHRDEDGELLGYLRPGEAGFVPVTLFGHPLGEAGDEHDAAAVLDEIGLSYLAGRWLLTLPDRAEPIAVQVIEADADHVRVKSIDYAADIGALFTLPVPTDRLHAQP
ncbi:hypothetical protein [Kutzneria sp. CA-103260]|uniref:hypothetical protein n=1 Tax=Kutzneria sp. CA-103260 TaxID=2802641 RepID=UPI001BA68282|nr:hypothetical protein [Kutzneria sp. CA-103260]QUQ70198.1 hypothetical protein JJ691_79730 [Kutzneria sp. CA-103260]